MSRSDGADGEKGNAASDSPALSGDGRLVAFSSAAANLDPADLDNVADVFVRDLTRHTTAIVSLSDGPTGGKGDGDSTAPALSQTGRFVAFASLSALDPADADTLGDVYSRDVVTGRTRLLSRAAGVLGAKGDGASDSPSISADARFVVLRLGGDQHPSRGRRRVHRRLRARRARHARAAGSAAASHARPGDVAGTVPRGAGELPGRRHPDGADERRRPPQRRPRLGHPASAAADRTSCAGWAAATACTASGAPTGSSAAPATTC